MKKIRKVVFFNNGLGRGGAHQSMLAWVASLRDSDRLEPFVFCGSKGWFSDSLEADGIPHAFLTMPSALGRIKHGSWQVQRGRTLWRILLMVPGLMKAWWRVATTRCDAVVLTGGRDFLMLLPLAWRKMAATVAVPQTTDWGRIPTCYAMCRLCKEVWAISQPVADSIEEMGVPGQKIKVVDLIYSVDRADDPIIGSEVKDRWNLPSEGVVIGVAGVIRPQKGQMLAVEAFSQVAAAVSNAVLVIMGSAQEDSPASVDYLEAVRSRIDTEELRERVRLTGWVDDLPSLLRTIDILLVPSVDNEGVPRVIIEALEAGVPVFSTDLAQFRDIFAGNGGGRLIEGRDPTHWAVEIRSVLEDPEALEKMSRSARELWEREFSRAHAEPMFIASLEALVGGRA